MAVEGGRAWGGGWRDLCTRVRVALRLGSRRETQGGRGVVSGKAGCGRGGGSGSWLLHYGTSELRVSVCGRGRGARAVMLSLVHQNVRVRASLGSGRTGGLINGADDSRLGSPWSLSWHTSRLLLRAQGGRTPGGADAVSERPWSASRRKEGEVSVLECTGRVTNEGRRTTVSVSCISAARSRLDGRSWGDGRLWRRRARAPEAVWLGTQWAGLPIGAPSQPELPGAP